MAKVSVISVSGSVVGDQMSETFGATAAISMTNPNAPGGVPTSIALAIGVNTIAIPALSQVAGGFALLQPPAGSSNAKLYKAVSGDAGTPFTAGFIVVPMSVGFTQFVITSTTTETIQIYFG